MDEITRLIWDKSQHRGNALLILFAIADSIGQGDARPKLPALAARLGVSDRQAERLEREIRESGELVVLERGGRGKGNLYEIPAIREALGFRGMAVGSRPERPGPISPQPWTTAEEDGGEWEIVQDSIPAPDWDRALEEARGMAAGFVRYLGTTQDGERLEYQGPPDGHRIASRGVVSPSNLSPFLESPSDLSAFDLPSILSPFSSPGGDVPTNPTGNPESPSSASAFAGNVGTLATDDPGGISALSTSKDKSISKDDDKGRGAGEGSPRKRRGRRRAPAADEIPFPDDWNPLADPELGAQAWAAENLPVEAQALLTVWTLSWADQAIRKGWTAIGLRGWRAAWRNGMRKALEFAIRDGRIRIDPARAQAPQDAPPAQGEAEGLMEYEEIRAILDAEAAGKGAVPDAA